MAKLSMHGKAKFRLHEEKEYGKNNVCLVLIETIVIQIHLEPCPEGYEDWFPGSNFCYKLKTDACSKREARTKCHWDNAVLISTTNEVMVKCIANKMKQSEAKCDNIWADIKRVTIGNTNKLEMISHIFNSSLNQTGSEKCWVSQNTNENPNRTPWGAEEKYDYIVLSSSGKMLSHDPESDVPYVCIRAHRLSTFVR